MSDLIIARTAGLQREKFDEPGRGTATWFTFFSAGHTPTSKMTAGVMELEAGGRLFPHSHLQPEIYFLAAGSGIVTVDGISKRVALGDAIFIPGNAEHSLENAGNDLLRVFYVFPTDCFDEIVYRFKQSYAQDG